MADVCGAKTRSGAPCKNAAMANGRCRMHGGKSPKTNQNAVKPGSLYSKHLTAEEQGDFNAIELGGVDDELRLTRIRLARALALESQNGEKLELDSAVKKKGGKDGDSTEVHTKRRDYVSIIDRLTGRIESLEARRLALINQALDAELKRAELAEMNADRAAPQSIRITVRRASKSNE
ncbi:HGGxSTG domain-containing protein [Cupriavidus sp. CV2]|uniref:HGGxSTG domain-containing protein n=1 Tax=Cupriavidus ulmosensis TaxID=3065913 RepID=UPI00296AFE8C|nr:HGGxSTG domain-containing protein [Cupriavidus sp. CV2]MDW3683094.1 HGGxSTG domain-containing protein [Cupriavidus sp. CV2]